MIAKTVSAIIRERYVDTTFISLNQPPLQKAAFVNCLWASVTHHVDAVGGVLYELADFYLLSSWMPTLLNHRGIDLQMPPGLPPRSRLAVRWARWRWRAYG